MEMKTLQIPTQTDLSRYLKLLREVCDENKIIRWYISSVNSTLANIEVVVEENGIGKSRLPLQ